MGLDAVTFDFDREFLPKGVSGNMTIREDHYIFNFYIDPKNYVQENFVFSHLLFDLNENINKTKFKPINEDKKNHYTLTSKTDEIISVEGQNTSPTTNQMKFFHILVFKSPQYNQDIALKGSPSFALKDNYFSNSLDYDERSFYESLCYGLVTFGNIKGNEANYSFNITFRPKNEDGYRNIKLDINLYKKMAKPETKKGPFLNSKNAQDAILPHKNRKY